MSCSTATVGHRFSSHRASARSSSRHNSAGPPSFRQRLCGQEQQLGRSMSADRSRASASASDAEEEDDGEAERLPLMEGQELGLRGKCF